MQAWQATVQDDFGNAIPNPVVTVYEADGVTEADIFNEAETALPNPLTGDIDGFIQFYAEPGNYKVDNGSEVWDVEIGGLEVAEEALAVASGAVTSLRNARIDFASYLPSDDSLDVWAALKSLLENPSAERDSLVNGATLTFRGGRAYRALTRAPIVLPRFLRMEMNPGAFLDFTGNANTGSPDLFSHAGEYGRPIRPAGLALDALQTSITLGASEIAASGLQPGDRILIRATEGLQSSDVGAWQTQSLITTSTPASFSIYTPGASYTLGAGVISNTTGRSYRVTTAHTAGATMNLANFVIEGRNAIGEDAYIEAIRGDVIYLTGPLRYTYVTASRPMITKYEGGGSFHITGLNFVGNDPANLVDRGQWATGVAYEPGEMVFVPSTVGGGSRYWQIMSAHTSGTFTTDATAGRLVNLGSDRVLRFEMADRVLIEGGRFERVSGLGISANAVGQLVVRDHVGLCPPKRAMPGGYLAISGGYNGALIDNVQIHSGGQPFMTTENGAEYGVGYGVTMRDCTAYGGNSAFTQHWQEENHTYENCVHEGGVASAIGGSSFDIRVPSRMLNCAVRNAPSRAVVLRNNFGGFVGANRRNEGTLIQGFKAHRTRTGIQLDDTMFTNLVTSPRDWPSGRLVIRDCEFTQLGIQGASQGAIDLRWTRPETTGGTDFPLLGKVVIQNVLVEAASALSPVRIGGRWQEPEVRGLECRAAPGYAGTGNRSVRFWNNDAPAGENRPINPIIQDIRFDAAFTAPLSTALMDAVLPVAEYSLPFTSITAPVDYPAVDFATAATPTVNFINNAGVMRGKTLTIVFTAAALVRHRNGGAGGVNSIWLNGGSNFSATVGSSLTVLSDGSAWREIGRA